MITIAERVLGHSEMEGKIEEILEDAKELTSISPEDLQKTLIVSGVALGAEESQRYLMVDYRNFADNVKKAADDLAGLIQHLDDEEAINHATKIRDKFLGALRERNEAVISVMVSEMSRLFAIDEELLKPSTDFANTDRWVLEMAGHRAFAASPHVFFGWDMATKTGTIKAMKCTCPGCMIDVARKAKANEVQAMESAVVRHEGLGNVFREFALYLLGQLRSQITDTLAGDSSYVDEHKMSLAQITSIARGLGRG